jgi:fluoroacetyl-CoA thioesterase
MPVQPGLQAWVERTVGDTDTAAALGSGDIPVLGTPAVVALCEAAAVKAVSGALGDGETTVGVRIEIEHVAPTLPGTRVVARAELVEVDGRTLVFTVEATDSSGVVAQGTHSRVVVGRARFLDNARERSG